MMFSKRRFSPTIVNFFLDLAKKTFFDPCHCPKIPNLSQIFLIVAQKILLLPKYFLVAPKNYNFPQNLETLKDNSPLRQSIL